MSSAAYVVGGLLALVLAIVVESRVSEPIVPLRMFTNRTIALATIACVAVGTAMFGGSVFLAQYFQIARGFSPTHAGLMTLPLVLGMFASSTASGQVISRSTGRVKPFLVFGAAALVVSLGLLSTIDVATDLVLVGSYLGLMGIGLGCLMQNLVLAVQNTTSNSQMGSVTSVVTFFRTLGGSSGVSVLGAVLASQVASYVAAALAGVPGAPSGGQDGSSLNVESLPGPVQEIVRAAYGQAFGDIFLIAAIVSLVTLVAVVLIKEQPLRTTVEWSSESSEPAEDTPVSARSRG